ncbi:urease accessory protein UreJ [Vibrio halioticoli NBRC 102217]|uniref:Urease accessory protein UreJ n=1 Tax=Vibrio halioticoli NBRC 102217 TaxID=1219072 RepID=V5FIE9_9VIBR|nr:HupE/UreJ family protein [Vibrio halioticoli]GAD89606.1 urease accessory protein UreJ [Vibrio halioticoli NBRC 102217]
MRAFVLFLLCLSVPAYAHTGHLVASSGFKAGFLHPLFGLDHLFAMLCVGITSSRLGGKALWRVPLYFIVLMMVGFMLGRAQLPFPYFESLIGLSLVFFGLLLVPNKPLRLGYIALPITLFALAHGFAHGSEIGGLNNPWLFQQGFLLASIIIHIVGVGIGCIPTTKVWAQHAAKSAFIAVAVYGVFLL